MGSVELWMWSLLQLDPSALDSLNQPQRAALDGLHSNVELVHSWSPTKRPHSIKATRTHTTHSYSIIATSKRCSTDRKRNAETNFPLLYN